MAMFDLANTYSRRKYVSEFSRTVRMSSLCIKKDCLRYIYDAVKDLKKECSDIEFETTRYLCSQKGLKEFLYCGHHEILTSECVVCYAQYNISYWKKYKITLNYTGNVRVNNDITLVCQFPGFDTVWSDVHNETNKRFYERIRNIDSYHRFFYHPHGHNEHAHVWRVSSNASKYLKYNNKYYLLRAADYMVWNLYVKMYTFYRDKSRFKRSFLFEGNGVKYLSGRFRRLYFDLLKCLKSKIFDIDISDYLS